MPETNPNDVVKATARFFGGAQQTMENIFYWRMSETSLITPDDKVMEAIADKLEAMYSLINMDLSLLFYYDSILFYNVTQSRPMGIMEWPTLTHGTETGQMYAEGCAGLVVAPTGVKRTRGRKFIPGYTEDRISVDNLTTTALEHLVLWAAQWLLYVVGDDFSMRPGVWDVVNRVFHLIIGASAKALVAYQRRRKPGRGI